MNREATGLAGARHLSFETLGSTNAEALARARAGEHGPLWITAATQSAGRGRRGNIWISPPGNLYATLLLRAPSAPAVAPQLSFVTGLALHDAVSDTAPPLAPALRLKWPNDLLLAGKKLAGILIEGESEPAFCVAVGIGVNCASHPQWLEHPTTDLLAAGTDVKPDRLLAAFAVAMDRRLAQWRGGKSFAAIRADWLERADGLGADIRVRLPDRELRGRFEGLDEAGRLLLANAAGMTTVTAGEVFGF
ncbi:MAG TPA: biotin--[acetyl-CoA-carboxylase] ligase [Pseudolabrys sp.]|nr:biotin--[acetyl-CoA-carboxylase] ligase [Pseudolabrys sp.]